MYKKRKWGDRRDRREIMTHIKKGGGGRERVRESERERERDSECV